MVRFITKSTELELELIQSHMAQKPMLRGEVGCAREPQASSMLLPNSKCRIFSLVSVRNKSAHFLCPAQRAPSCRMTLFCVLGRKWYSGSPRTSIPVLRVRVISLAKIKKGRVISLFLAYDRGSNPRPRAYKPVFVPLDYLKLSLSRFIKI